MVKNENVSYLFLLVLLFIASRFSMDAFNQKLSFRISNEVEKNTMILLGENNSGRNEFQKICLQKGKVMNYNETSLMNSYDLEYSLEINHKMYLSILDINFQNDLKNLNLISNIPGKNLNFICFIKKTNEKSINKIKSIIEFFSNQPLKICNILLIHNYPKEEEGMKIVSSLFNGWTYSSSINL
jgi:hypothetical protein